MTLLALTLLPIAGLGQEEMAEGQPEPAKPKRTIPFDERPYKIRVLCSFSNDAQLTPQLRGDVFRRFQSHSAAFVGDVWKLDLQDVSGTLTLVAADEIAAVTDQKIEPFTEDQDKVFVLGVRSAGDRFLLAGREFDAGFSRWGPVFQASSRDTGQIARDLIVMAAQMFAPLARLETGDAKRVSITVRGGRLPGLNPAAVDAKSLYKPSLSDKFVRNGTLFRPMRPIMSEDGEEVIAVKQMGWTFYEVDRRDGTLMSCKIVSALRNVLPPSSRDLDGAQAIAARTAGGTTQIRLVHSDNQTPLSAMDVEVRESDDAAWIPLGTTDLDGRITVSPIRAGGGLVRAVVRHGRDTLALLPILPGAGDEPDLALKPDDIRLDIEGRVVPVQEQIIDQVARRKIIEARIRVSIKKKDWKMGVEMLKLLKISPSGEVMTKKLEETREYAKLLREWDKQTGKVKRMFSETELIISEHFDPDKMQDAYDDIEDELKAEADAAGVDLAQFEPPPAAAATAGAAASPGQPGGDVSPAASSSGTANEPK